MKNKGLLLLAATHTSPLPNRWEHIHPAELPYSLYPHTVPFYKPSSIDDERMEEFQKSGKTIELVFEEE